jgi:hypothetical protein
LFIAIKQLGGVGIDQGSGIFCPEGFQVDIFSDLVGDYLHHLSSVLHKDTVYASGK